MQNLAPFEANMINGLHSQMLNNENEKSEEKKENVEKENKVQQIP